MKKWLINFFTQVEPTTVYIAYIMSSARLHELWKIKLNLKEEKVHALYFYNAFQKKFLLLLYIVFCIHMLAAVSSPH